jgi:LuxR family maltose regulon positive regulatory protein
MLQAANKYAKKTIPMIITNEIADLSKHFILVLDDFHRANSPDINELLSGWIRHWPSPMHLVIISRTQPPLPLAGLKSREQLSEVRSRDLRFSPQEAADYISMMTKKDPHEKNLSALLDYFEGWVAGLKLLSLALNNAGADQTYKALLNKGETDITGYLADEVFSQMADPLQRLLMKISILESYNPSLCQSLLDSDEYDLTVKHFLSNLNSSELFITALDSEGEWYRFHQLLRDMLNDSIRDEAAKRSFMAARQNLPMDMQIVDSYMESGETTDHDEQAHHAREHRTAHAKSCEIAAAFSERCHPQLLV